MSVISTFPHISRRGLLLGAAATTVAGLGGRGTAFAADKVKLQFMYPVGVSGDINRIVTAMISKFNAAH